MKKGVVVVALFLIVLVGGLVFFSNDYDRNSKERVYDLTEEFNIQGNIVSAGVFDSSSGISGSVVDEFNELYKEGLKKGEKRSLVYGDSSEIHILGYEDFFKGEISMFTGKSVQRFKVNEEKFTERKLSPSTAERKVKVVISGNAVELDLEDNEGLYVVVSVDKGGRVNVRE